jgi:deoxyhypusine synthase
MEKKHLLDQKVQHFDMKISDPRKLVDQYRQMAFQARNIAAAADIYNRMLADIDCTVILCLAGSIFSAGLKQVVVDLVDHNMVDVIVSTGAIMVDQDFFEALGFLHYRGSPRASDDELMKLQIDRIYDTYIDEEDLRKCDYTIKEIADTLPPGPYSSRQFLNAMGEYLQKRKTEIPSVISACVQKEVPVFVPAFSDSSAGFGLVFHQARRGGGDRVRIDSVQDFLELTRIKIKSPDTGLFMIGGGVPKNFAQDIPVAAEILGQKVSMHKYAIQITVADERDGGLSGSTLKEAHSWGKVDTGNEQMVFSEATLAAPLITGYAYHTGKWKQRKELRLNRYLEECKDE